VKSWYSIPSPRLRRLKIMSFLAASLAGQTITHVLADTEVTYIMLANGTQITIRGLVIVEPVQARAVESSAVVR
jgi:hypothetical protein